MALRERDAAEHHRLKAVPERRIGQGARPLRVRRPALQRDSRPDEVPERASLQGPAGQVLGRPGPRARGHRPRGRGERALHGRPDPGDDPGPALRESRSARVRRGRSGRLELPAAGARLSRLDLAVMGGAEVTSSPRSCARGGGQASTARSKASSFARDGFVKPLILRTYWSAAARTSSSRGQRLEVVGRLDGSAHGRQPSDSLQPPNCSSSV